MVDTADSLWTLQFRQALLLAYKIGGNVAPPKVHILQAVKWEMRKALLDLHREHVPFFTLWEAEQTKGMTKPAMASTSPERLLRQLCRSSFRCLASMMASVTPSPHSKILRAYGTGSMTGMVFYLTHCTATQFLQGIALSPKKIQDKTLQAQYHDHLARNSKQ